MDISIFGRVALFRPSASGVGFLRVDVVSLDRLSQPMLAHKAAHEGKVVAEVAAGRNSSFDVRAIPSVAYRKSPGSA